MNDKYGLVLEGGGFRGCYTAGALKWLNDHNIHFSYSVSISAAAAYAFYYAALNDEANYNISINGVNNRKVLGLYPLLHEGGLVGYNYLKDNFLLPDYQKALQYLRSSSSDLEVGLFNMDKQQLEYFNKNQLDDSGEMIKGCCVLPLTGKFTKVNGSNFLDGGIRTMVSIERSIETGHSKNLIIVTKDKNYVRKPNNFFVNFLLKIRYKKYKTMLSTLDNRVETYYHEMGLVNKLEEDGKALLIRPSKDCGVGRFSGTKEQMIEMYNLGWQDMEDNKEKISKFLEVDL